MRGPRSRWIFPCLCHIYCFIWIKVQPKSASWPCLKYFWKPGRVNYLGIPGVLAKTEKPKPYFREANYSAAVPRKLHKFSHQELKSTSGCIGFVCTCRHWIMMKLDLEKHGNTDLKKWLWYPILFPSRSLKVSDRFQIRQKLSISNHIWK